MPNDACCGPRAPPEAEGRRALLALAAGLLLGPAACAPRRPPDTVAAPDPSRPGLTVISREEALPLDEAVVHLADASLGAARELPELQAGGRRRLVIDPLIDRASGAETAATRRAVVRIEEVVRQRHRGLELRPFTLAELEARPLILLGAMTPAAGEGSLTAAAGPSGTYRIWAVLGDLRSGLILAHPTAWVQAETVDPMPSAFHGRSPAWTEDEMVAAYLRTCAADAGQPMDPLYLGGLRAAAATAEGVAAFEREEHARALTLFETARAAPGPPPMRALNGLYLANAALGRSAAAEEAFGRVVAHGLSRGRLGVKLLFRPGSTAFVEAPALSAPYPMWLRRIAARAAAGGTCLLVSGHASVTGSAAVNDRLSLARAEAVRGRLLAAEPRLRGRVRAEGRGSREPIIGLGTDDLRDALDRRVEFRPVPCGLQAA
jgi:hypothetical protein